MWDKDYRSSEDEDYVEESETETDSEREDYDDQNIVLDTKKYIAEAENKFTELKNKYNDYQKSTKFISNDFYSYFKDLTITEIQDRSTISNELNKMEDCLTADVISMEDVERVLYNLRKQKSVPIIKYIKFGQSKFKLFIDPLTNTRHVEPIDDKDEGSSKITNESIKDITVLEKTSLDWNKNNKNQDTSDLFNNRKRKNINFIEKTQFLDKINQKHNKESLKRRTRNY